MKTFLLIICITYEPDNCLFDPKSKTYRRIIERNTHAEAKVRADEILEKYRKKYSDFKNFTMTHELYKKIA